jgi:hypothetical protein
MEKSENKSKPKLKGKRQKPLERKVADDLIKLHERNEKLREKTIKTDFFKLF